MGLREVEREEREMSRLKVFLFLSFFVSGVVVGFLRVQMASMWSSSI